MAFSVLFIHVLVNDLHLLGTLIETSYCICYSRRTCWVCFATEDDDPTIPWVQPCNCRGTTKWVCSCGNKTHN